MIKFEEIVESFDCIPCNDCNKYNSLGKTYFVDNEFYKGSYWYYESNDFYIDIHDFYIKKDYVVNSSPDLSPYMFLISNYLISGSGEWFNPYQTISSNTMLTLDTNLKNFRYILHGNCHFFLVGIKFKESMINEYILNKIHINKRDVSQIFFDTNKKITKPISKLAKEILNCKMDNVSAELFFDAKAKEWLSITLDSYLKKQKENPLNSSDIEAIDSVAKYIDDHYSFNISQDILEQISMMSGTKLKNSFKNRYNMSITEYTQRKRINFAENLLLTTDLEIKDVAKSVGYSSPSRFTTLFKRYKGKYPKDIKQLAKNEFLEVCNCNKNIFK